MSAKNKKAIFILGGAPLGATRVALALAAAASLATTENAVHMGRDAPNKEQREILFQPERERCK